MKRLAKVLLCSLLLDGTAATADEADLEAVRAAYRALSSYSDTATLVVEFGSAGSPSVERNRFTTRVRKPRHYQFDYREDPASGGERVVIWSDAEVFRTWWSTTGIEGVYPKGTGSSAFALTSTPSRGASLYLAPLLFPEAGLQGPLTAFGEITAVGEEMLGNRKCLKFKGVQRQAYRTGHAGAGRAMTVWIDAKTFLVRKIFEDTPQDYLRGNVHRITVTFDPVADPPLEDAQFRFEAPAG